MAVYGTCRGCMKEAAECASREALRAALSGFGVRSIKWTCRDRTPRFSPGQPVWAVTVACYSQGTDFTEFPAVFVGTTRAKALVYIVPGALSRDESYGFEGKGDSGFCALPFSRLSERDGEHEVICRYCQLPSSRGHTHGYSCNPIDPEVVW